MKRVLRNSMSIAAGSLALLASLLAVPSAQATSGSTAPLVKLTPMGQPAWVPVDLHVFTAPIGTVWDGYAGFGSTLATILPPPHYQSNPCLGRGPGTPESPPYNQDVANGVANAGYLQGHVFAPQGFSNGSGVYLAYMVVPSSSSSTIGSSPDFTEGPIIPNSLFPIQVTGVTDRASTPFDPFLANFNVPALDTLTTPCTAFNVDGSSHFPIFVADNADFGPPGAKLPGEYTYQVTMQDATGAGWSISARFVVSESGGASH